MNKVLTRDIKDKPLLTCNHYSNLNQITIKDTFQCITQLDIIPLQVETLQSEFNRYRNNKL